MTFQPYVLYVDRGGRPARWLGWQSAAVLMTQGRVSWHTGGVAVTVNGGRSATTGRRTTLEIPAILAGRDINRVERETPPLTNANLFARDRYTCMYCGTHSGRLTRDHVMPQCQGGPDIWENVVAACAACNSRKGGRTPEQAGMPLLAIPYRPTWSEYLVLANRRILSDQMVFLTAFLPAGSRWRGGQ